MTRATSVRALVLDFDGVIVESNALKTLAFERVFARFPEHAAAMMAYHEAHVSDSRFVKFRHFATECLGRTADDPMVEELAAQFSAEMLQLVNACPFVAGAPELLARLHGRLPMYLASVTPEAELVTILNRRNLVRFFAGVYGCPPWTKSAAIEDVAAAAGGGPGALLFVGDSAGDQRAARAAGVEFIARDSGLPFDPPPPRAFPTLFEIADIIEARL